jgi:hypothetical protein
MKRRIIFEDLQTANCNDDYSNDGYNSEIFHIFAIQNIELY